VSHLLDINFLIACGWKSHANHRAARQWLDSQTTFYTSRRRTIGDRCIDGSFDHGEGV